MELKNALKKLYLKLTIFTLMFIVFLVGYIFSFKFYGKNLEKKINELVTLKEKINQSQINKERELRLKQMIVLIENKSGKKIENINNLLENKINLDFEETKNLILNKFNSENWLINTQKFDYKNKEIFLNFKLPTNDFEKFYNFLIDEGLITKINNFKIKKVNNSFNIEGVFHL